MNWIDGNKWSTAASLNEILENHFPQVLLATPKKAKTLSDLIQLYTTHNLSCICSWYSRMTVLPHTHGCRYTCGGERSTTHFVPVILKLLFQCLSSIEREVMFRAIIWYNHIVTRMLPIWCMVFLLHARGKVQCIHCTSSHLFYVVRPVSFL